MARMRCAQAKNPTGYGAFLWLSRCAYELEQDSWAGLGGRCGLSAPTNSLCSSCSSKRAPFRVHSGT